MEVIGGVNQNSFFDFQNDNRHFSSSHKSDYGYTIRVGLEDIKVKWMTLRFTLSYDKYGGEINASSGGLGGGYRTNAKVNKSVISLGVFPVNFKIKDKIDLNFGFELSRLISENFIGMSDGWLLAEPYWNFDLNDRYDRYSSRNYFGLRGRIAYDFIISDKLVISPQYSYYYGLSNELVEFPESTKSMRHYICIGLQKALK